MNFDDLDFHEATLASVSSTSLGVSFVFKDVAIENGEKVACIVELESVRDLKMDSKSVVAIETEAADCEVLSFDMDVRAFTLVVEWNDFANKLYKTRVCSGEFDVARLTVETGPGLSS